MFSLSVIGAGVGVGDISSMPIFHNCMSRLLGYCSRREGNTGDRERSHCAQAGRELFCIADNKVHSILDCACGSFVYYTNCFNGLGMYLYLAKTVLVLWLYDTAGYTFFEIRINHLIDYADAGLFPLRSVQEGAYDISSISWLVPFLPGLIGNVPFSPMFPPRLEQLHNLVLPWTSAFAIGRRFSGTNRYKIE